jgi:hypothetical protein
MNPATTAPEVKTSGVPPFVFQRRAWTDCLDALMYPHRYSERTTWVGPLLVEREETTDEEDWEILNPQPQGF